MVKKYILFVLIIFSLLGCSYSVKSNSFPYLKRLQLMAFENKSSEFALGETVINSLSGFYLEDGRLRLVTQQPDCLLEGSILSYNEKIYSYDTANNIQDYNEIVTFSVTFTDMVNNKVIYENKSLSISELYAVSDASTSRFKTKQEAIQEICSKLFKTIMQNTLESW
jgi:hypothetical protein